MAKRIGLLFGMEDTFPWALIDAVNSRAGEEMVAEPVSVAEIRDDADSAYDLILDRISHEVPFYRTYLKQAVYRGAQVINNPFWWSADDKFFGCLAARSIGVAVPRTVLLPHKQHPPNTTAQSYRNLRLIDWDDVFRYLGFPLYLKPAHGGGWKDVYRCEDRDAFFAAYDQTRDLSMMAQEAIDYTEYYRCYVFGRERVRVMPYDPRQPHSSRYVCDAAPAQPDLHARMILDALKLCRALGYDMNTVEFAVRAGVPCAIDFTNCAPDADLNSVGRENFDWAVANMAEVLIEAVRKSRPFEFTGSWPSLRHLQR